MNRLFYTILSSLMLLTGIILGFMKMTGRDNGAVNYYTLFIFLFFGIMGFATRHYLTKLDE
jgi:hypothetical protein